MSKALIKLGSASLAKQAPTLKAQNPNSETEDKQPITNFNKWLEPLSDDTFISVVRLLKMPSYLAIPVMQIAASQFIKHTKQPIWKQVQHAFKLFCPLITKWSVSDAKYYHRYYQNQDIANSLKERHRLKYNLYSDCMHRFDSLYGFENQQFEIWFLNDKLLETKIFKERNWKQKQQIVDLETKDASELVSLYFDELAQQKAIKSSMEQDDWTEVYLAGFNHETKPKFKDRASQIAFACGWGIRYDCDTTGFYPNWLDMNCC